MAHSKNSVEGLTGKNPSQKVVCRLPSGQLAVTTVATCLADGGIIEEKVLDTSSFAPSADANALYLYSTPHGINVIGTFANALADRGAVVGKITGHVPH